MTRAIIFVPEGHPDPVAHAHRCMEWIQGRGYEFGGMTCDWKDATDLLYKGATDAVIVSRPDHLDPRRQPRVEVVGDGPASPVPGTPARRRPRSI